jgi:hypothetical protein
MVVHMPFANLLVGSLRTFFFFFFLSITEILVGSILNFGFRVEN